MENKNKNDIRRTMDVSIAETSAYKEAIKEIQKLTVEATEEIADNYVEVQRKIVEVIRPACYDQPEDRYGNLTSTTLGNMCSRMASKYADNTVAFTRIIDNIISAALHVLKSSTRQTIDHANESSRIGVNVAKIFK